MVDIVIAKILIGIHPYSEDYLILRIDPDGLIGRKPGRMLVPPKILTMNRIPFQDIPHHYRIPEIHLSG